MEITTPVELLPERLMRFTLRDLKWKRQRLEGFLSIGNEVHRAHEYDEWIAALEEYCKQYDGHKLDWAPP